MVAPPGDPGTFYTIPIGDQQELGNPCGGGGMFFPGECFTLNPPADPPDGFSLVVSNDGCHGVPSIFFPSYKLGVNAPAVPGQTYFVKYMFSTPDGGSDSGELQVLVSEKRLAVVISAAPSVTLGNNLTYTITVTNNGPDAATGVTMTDPLPGTVTFVSATPSQGTCKGMSTVSCGLGTLTHGSTATVDIVVTPTQVGPLTNTASVQANESDPNTPNNSDPLTTTVLAPSNAGLGITLTSSPQTVVRNRQLILTATVTNSSASDATTVVVTYTPSIPLAQVAIETIKSSQGACSPPVGSNVTCQLGSLGGGAMATITMTAFPAVPGTFTSTATVTSDEFAPSTAVVTTMVQ